MVTRPGCPTRNWRRVRRLDVAAKTRCQDLLAYGLFMGLIAGFLTDAIVTAAGA
jgi:zinc transporter, ZIP family